MAAKDLIAGGTIGPMIYQPSRLFHCHSPGTTRLCRPLIKLLDPSLPRTRTGRIWTYVGDRDHPYTVYDYTPTRSRDGPDSFMKEFHGYLQADAYSGYSQPPRPGGPAGFDKVGLIIGRLGDWRWELSRAVGRGCL